MRNGDDNPVLVVGAGSWGTALAILLAGNGVPTLLWGRETDDLRKWEAARCNTTFLPGINLPPRLELEPDLERALGRTRDLLIAVPSVAFRSTLRTIAALGKTPLRLAWGTKGFDPGTGKLLHEVVAEELSADTASAVISGPTFATEVAKGLPTAVTVATGDPDFADVLGHRLANERFRVYTSEDVIGVEIGGAVKNVLAIAAGIADGLGFGANTRAALVTRGLAEITRFGVALGGQRETFMGLAGLGDLVLTCTDDQSRNRRFGLAIGEGLSSEQAHRSIGQVVEGEKTVLEVVAVAHRLGIDMPISHEVHQVIYHGKAPLAAVNSLFAREPKPEVTL
jgi:glycerol-3-phosphate dehydrogenase (NAD(P)+)